MSGSDTPAGAGLARKDNIPRQPGCDAARSSELASTTGATRGRNQVLSMPDLRKVTVIDDDPTMLKAIERLLRVKGFEVETFASAEAFLAGSGRRPVSFWTSIWAECPASSCGVNWSRLGPSLRLYSSLPSTMRPHIKQPRKRAASRICGSHFWQVC